jgi:hypothetical protein
MPRLIINPPSTPRKYERLVKRLRRELASPSDEGQPLIIERNVPAAKSRHVHVIWDDWQGITDEERTTIIVEAYSQEEGDEKASDITIALGVTPEEAVVLGLLPYKVEPTHRHRAEETLYRVGLAEEAKNTLLGANARELRYVSQDEAAKAVQRLKKYAKNSSWMIVREEQSESD